jgi:hypothetical protein
MGEVVVALMVSAHIGLSGDFNNIHPSIMIKNNEYVAGVYKNSYYKPSYYGGMIKEYNGFEIQYGAVTGYVKPLVPFIAVKKELVKDLKLVVIPSFDVTHNNPGIVLGLEISK